jgi:cyclopropane fatty-acyl-phospholipid synthase-like methyltransferase
MPDTSSPVEPPLITERAAFRARFPLPPELEARSALAGKQEFVRSFVAARDAIEAAYYAIADQRSTPGTRTRRFLGAMLNPMLGKPMRDVEHFYQTFGRLMRLAWLSISAGLYDDALQGVQDTAQRLLLAQVHTVDTNWRPAVSHIASTRQGRGLIVEVGTGRGNSVARLGMLLPDTRIVSITISPEQHELVTGLVRELGLKNVEIRRGDLFDPSVTEDLVGQADAVGAIEVVLHFPAARKLEGMQRMTRLLKPGAPLCLIDSAIERPLSAFSERYYANQSIYFGLREQYFQLFEQAALTPVSYVDYTPDMNQSFKETTQVLRQMRPRLQQEFGRLMSWLWPEVPGTVYVRTLTNVRYVHAVGLKR